MKPVAIFVLFVLYAAAAVGQTPVGENPEKEVIAIVGGKKFSVEDKDRLSGLILGQLLEQFARDNRIEPSEEELEVFIRKSDEMQRRHRMQMEQDRKNLVAELKDSSLSAQRRKEIESRLQTIESILQSNREMNTETGGQQQLLSMKRRIARQVVRSWKINKALYARYGGRVIFQQAGVEPLDAYRDFLREQQRSGAFRIVDKRCEASFWRYFTDDAMHAFYPQDEGARFINTPWWLMESPPEE